MPIQMRIHIRIRYYLRLFELDFLRVLEGLADHLMDQSFAGHCCWVDPHLDLQFEVEE